MSDLSLTELRLIPKNRNIKGYRGLPKDELLINLNISGLSFSELKLIAKGRRIMNYEDMSKDELLNTFKKSVPFKDIKEIRKENSDGNKIIRDLRVLYEREEDYYFPQKIKDAFDGDYIEFESNWYKDEILSIKEYLNMIRPCLGKITDDHKDEWKVQLTMEISFVYSVKDSNEDSNKDSNTIHIHSENASVFVGYETDNITKELYKSLLEEYQIGLKRKMKRSDLAFDSVDALYYKFHKISLNRGGSYIDSPEWLKNKKATINPKNKKDDKCFL